MLSSDTQRSILDFVTSFETLAPTIVDDIENRQGATVSEFFSSGDRAVIRDAAAVGVAIAMSAMRIPSETPTVAPEASLREARDVAAANGSLAGLLQSYRIGHAVIQEHMMLHAEQVRTPMLAVRVMTERLFAHIDRLMMHASREYMEERRRRNANVDQMLYARVRRALAGEVETLPYPVEGHHVAVVFDPQATPDAPDRLVAAIDRPTLRTPTPAGEIWLWLEVGESAGEGDVRSVLDAVVAAGAVGVSEPRGGYAGLAVAHRQARLACRLGGLRGERVSAYSEVALEALAFGGQDVARDFARAELGLLADDGERTETLRRTVQTYFASGNSAAAAAVALGIAERTVTYRLRRAEELVGRPLSTRRAEIEAALRLHRVLDFAV